MIKIILIHFQVDWISFLSYSLLTRNVTIPIRYWGIGTGEYWCWVRPHTKLCGIYLKMHKDFSINLQKISPGNCGLGGISVGRYWYWYQYWPVLVLVSVLVLILVLVSVFVLVLIGIGIGIASLTKKSNSRILRNQP
jgi:hypothetical protein